MCKTWKTLARRRERVQSIKGRRSLKRIQFVDACVSDDDAFPSLGSFLSAPTKLSLLASIRCIIQWSSLTDNTEVPQARCCTKPTKTNKGMAPNSKMQIGIWNMKPNDIAPSSCPICRRSDFSDACVSSSLSLA
uniref:Uncharacterized protein n=2 Tax=Physcomitrium patens TaxID=3218 RepID=A0A7I4A1M7_PHYPA